jgi:glutamate carboxypeptidase
MTQRVNEPTAAQTIFAALQPRYEAFLADLATLVGLDSGSYDREDVEQVGDWLRARCATWGAEIVLHDGGTFARSFAATLRGTGRGHIMLLGHMDTVFSHGTTAERPLRLVDGRAIGPGTCDMKGGLLTAIYAIEALRRLSLDHFATVRFVCNSDEEVGAPSSSAFVERMAQGMDAVLVLESARQNGDIVSQRRGMGVFRLDVSGRAAHAGVEPEKGRSAALTLCRQVLALQDLHDHAAGRTVTTGTLQAGTRPNVIPDHAMAEVDLRADTIAEMEALLTDAEAALARTVMPDTTYTWRSVQYRPPWGPQAGTTRLVASAQQVARELGFTIEAVKTGGTSDGNFTAALGIPTLDGLGPIGGLDHSPAEYIDCASIMPRAAMLAGIMLKVSGD